MLGTYLIELQNPNKVNKNNIAQLEGNIANPLATKGTLSPALEGFNTV